MTISDVESAIPTPVPEAPPPEETPPPVRAEPPVHSPDPLVSYRAFFGLPVVVQFSGPWVAVMPTLLGLSPNHYWLDKPDGSGPIQTCIPTIAGNPNGPPPVQVAITGVLSAAPCGKALILQISQTVGLERQAPDITAKVDVMLRPEQVAFVSLVHSATGGRAAD